jgi:membrane fusion protein, multidrug efflux system
MIAVRKKRPDILLHALLALCAAALLSACHKAAEATLPDVRPVRTVTAIEQPAGETVLLTGHIEAENEAALSFRISGRMIERLVNVGDRVNPGQILARLDPQDEQNGSDGRCGSSLLRASWPRRRPALRH